MLVPGTNFIAVPIATRNTGTTLLWYLPIQVPVPEVQVLMLVASTDIILHLRIDTSSTNSYMYRVNHPDERRQRAWAHAAEVELARRKGVPGKGVPGTDMVRRGPESRHLEVPR